MYFSSVSVDYGAHFSYVPLIAPCFGVHGQTGLQIVHVGPFNQENLET